MSGVILDMFSLGYLAYADDVVLLAPTPSAMRILLKICEEYGKEFSVVFNAAKSVCMQVSRTAQSSDVDLQFFSRWSTIIFC